MAVATVKSACGVVIDFNKVEPVSRARVSIYSTFPITEHRLSKTMKVYTKFAYVS